MKDRDQGTSELVKSIIEKYLTPRERFIFGFADLRDVPDIGFVDFRFGISIGQKLDYTIVDSIVNGPTPEYYAHYQQTNQDLFHLSHRIEEELNQKGIETISIEPTNSMNKRCAEYTESLRSRLSHKMVATRAGLGWIGKTALLISKEFGPRFRMVSILTSTPLSNNTAPVDKSRCGKCNICVEACPADAATGQLWNTSLHRNDFFDAWKCRDQCKKFGEERIGANSRICGICVSVCPIGIDPGN